jgi:hypothetical protein
MIQLGIQLQLLERSLTGTGLMIPALSGPVQNFSGQDQGLSTPLVAD